MNVSLPSPIAVISAAVIGIEKVPSDPEVVEFVPANVPPLLKTTETVCSGFVLPVRFKPAVASARLIRSSPVTASRFIPLP